MLVLYASLWEIHVSPARKSAAHGRACAIPADEMGMDGIPSGQLKIIAAAAGCYFLITVFLKSEGCADCYPVNFYLRFSACLMLYIDRLPRRSKFLKRRCVGGLIIRFAVIFVKYFSFCFGKHGGCLPIQHSCIFYS